MSERKGIPTGESFSFKIGTVLGELSPFAWDRGVFWDAELSVLKPGKSKANWGELVARVLGQIC